VTQRSVSELSAISPFPTENEKRYEQHLTEKVADETLSSFKLSQQRRLSLALTELRIFLVTFFFAT
jgi:hypothetical protein